MSTRPRRTVRRAVMALAGCVVLLTWYVGTYFGMWWLVINGSTITPATFDVLNRTIYAPIVWYVNSGSPGSDLFVNWRNDVTAQAEKRARAEMIAKARQAREASLKSKGAAKSKQ